VLVALAGLWLARKGRTQVAVLVLAASAVAATAILVQSSEASQSHVVRADENTFLTINGRTDVWRNVLGGPKDWLIGHGVGEVGTAAERAEFGVFRTADEAEADVGPAVDSGYLAAIADTGLLGLVLLSVLFGRLAQLSVRAIRAGHSEGWVAAGLLTVILLDAVTRASFNGFPTAFLGLLLVGLALNAAEDAERREREAAAA
jgi:O-antigen ligase